MKSFEEKEAKLRPNWYKSLDLPNWQKDHPAMSWDFPKDSVPIVAALGMYIYLNLLLFMSTVDIL